VPVTSATAKSSSAAACSLSLLALCGCSVKDPIDAWQDSLTDYVARQGHGDPAVLRDLPQLRSSSSLRPAMIQFSKIDLPGFGLPPFVDRWDVHGVMLDSKSGTTAGYPFMIGVVKRPYSGPSTIEDIRLVVFQVDRDDFHWRLSRPDPEALRRYVDGAAENPRRLPAHPTHQVFPAIDDVFEYELNGDQAVARDVCSGATWRVELRRQGRLSAR